MTDLSHWDRGALAKANGVSLREYDAIMDHDDLVGLIERLVVEDPIFREAYEGFNDQCMYCGAKPEYVSRCQTDPKWPHSSHYHVAHESNCAWIAGMTYLGREIDHMHLVATYD